MLLLMLLMLSASFRRSSSAALGCPVPQNLTSNMRRECDDAEVGTDFCELSIAAFEDEMAERVGHRVAFAAWASGLGCRACELAVKSRLEHERVRVLPFDEAASFGFGFFGFGLRQKLLCSWVLLLLLPQLELEMRPSSPSSSWRRCR